jgi:hypothetical protein
MMGRTFEDAIWISMCNGGSCLEVAFRDGWVGVRDSKQGFGSTVLTFTADEWQAFITGVKEGRFDGP